MLVCSFRLAVVTLDRAEEAGRMVPVGANQRVEIERFIDSSRYEAGWAKGLIF